MNGGDEAMEVRSSGKYYFLLELFARDPTEFWEAVRRMLVSVSKNKMPAPAPAKQVFTCDPKNPVNPDFDCTQKVGPGLKCQYHWDPVKYQVWQCTELAPDHHGLTD